MANLLLLDHTDNTVRLWRIEDGVMMWSRGSGPDFNMQGAIIDGIQGVDPQDLVAYGAKKPV